MAKIVRQPVSILTGHDLSDFDCGRESLNHWLKKTSLKNEIGHASKTFVSCTDDKRVVGYYCLAAGSVESGETPGRIKRKMPNPIPVIVLGRLAVDLAWQGKGIGVGLLQDALQRCLVASANIGARAVLVHALDEEAKKFYLSYGFVESPVNDLTLMMSMLDVAKVFNEGST